MEFEILEFGIREFEVFGFWNFGVSEFEIGVWNLEFGLRSGILVFKAGV